MASPAAKSPNSSRIWPRLSTTSPSSAQWSPTPSIMPPAQIEMNTGSQQFGRPSFGAWTTYGLGSESENLPAFVVFSSGKKGPSGGNSNWGSGFLPTLHQGVQFRNSGDPVLYLSNPPVSMPTFSPIPSPPSGVSTNADWPTSAIPKSPPASTPSRWLSACSRVLRN
jgi:hypothetical protein